MTDHIPSPATDGLLYHWSPQTNRESIEAHGLRPGQRSNDGDWNPPHVCLAETPTLALSLCHGQQPLDLWVVNAADCVDLTRVDSEWRTSRPVRAERADSDLTPANQGGSAMTDHDQTLAAIIRSVTETWDEPLDEVHDIPPIVNAILASGWGPSETATEDEGSRYNPCRPECNGCPECDPGLSPLLAPPVSSDEDRAGDRLAKAWDEGARCAGSYGHEDDWTHEMHPFADNPYRDGSDQ